jgi:tetraprenyl-beta-curcumene synthase
LSASQRSPSWLCRAIARCPSAHRPATHNAGRDSQRLSVEQLAAVSRAAWRELTRGLPATAKELRHWRALAQTIPDACLREDALQAIDGKRANIEGAVFFATLATTHSNALLRLLAAYEVLADYLDCVSERGAMRGLANGVLLHRAMQDALDPVAPATDYYALSPWRDDGGFLEQLVQTCKQLCTQLPSFAAVAPYLRAVTALTDVLAINHLVDARERDRLLARWAARHFPATPGIAWYEWTGGASAWLTVLALLALAAEPHCTDRQAAAIRRAYLPWVSLTGTMLDSYGDAMRDVQVGDHVYIAHYPNWRVALDRTAAIIERAMTEVAALDHPERHHALVASMVAMYLSKDSTRDEQLREATRALARAGGTLTQLLVPIVRAWRLAYGQRAA